MRLHVSRSASGLGIGPGIGVCRPCAVFYVWVATYAVQVAGEKAPRRAIEPLEVNWEPARDSRVVVAGIVSEFLDALRFCSKR